MSHNKIHTYRRVRSFEEQQDHFMQRLKERYGLTITHQEYIDLCNDSGVFHGVFSKSGHNTLGWVNIQSIKVWVLRDGTASRLSTCYPPTIQDRDTEMIRACFGGVARQAALQIYRLYLKEAKRVAKMQFDSIKDAALFFFSKTSFAPLHIDQYKHQSVSTSKLCSIINSILCGESEHVRLSVEKIKKKNGK